MMPESGDDLQRKRRVFALLRETLDLPEPERDAWIVQRCAGDKTLAFEVQGMLAQCDAGPLDREAGAIAARLAQRDESGELPPGSRLGDWTIVRRLGSGGMGVVYLAEREGDGYTQRGALKRIKLGMDSTAVLSRFRRERQILSRLNHPNIARLLDGGIGADARPYFVMEYVEGATLATWSQRANATVDVRIQLFLVLCDAIAYAHRQLIVHRDIKPGNVLVDAQGRPRLLDFGIARLLETDTDESATATAAHFVSRAYAAPEQLQGRAMTTATDIFQLGALLHELLTGLRFADAAQEAATRPTQRLAVARERAGPNGPTAVPANALTGDIGIVLARATDADPTRRYATVEAFADDVHRWHAGHPVLARPDSVGYRLERFLGRHRLMVGMASLALAAIIVGAGVALWQARVARVEARRATAEAASATALQQFMLNAFTRAEPWHNGGKQPTALDLAKEALDRAETELAAQPSARADMYTALARLFSVAGDVRLAAVAGEKAVIALKTLPEADDERLFQARLRAAYGHFYTTDFDRTESMLAELSSAAMGNDTRTYALDGLRASLLRDRGQLQESAQLIRSMVERTPHVEGADLGEAIWHLHEIELALGHYPAAARAERRSREYRERKPATSPVRVGALLWAWNLAAELDAPGEAVTRLPAIVARMHQTFGESVYTAQALRVYAHALRQTGHDETAESVLREAARMAAIGFGGSAFDAAAARVDLASLLIDRGLAAEATPLLDAAIASYVEAGGDDDPRAWFARIVRARSEPRAVTQALNAAWNERRPAQLRERATALAWLAEAEARSGRIVPAQARWHETLAELDRQGRSLSVDAWQAHTALATTLARGGNTDAARDEHAIACEQAVLLFDTAAASAGECDKPGEAAAGTLDRIRWKQPMREQIAELERLGATVDAAVPLADAETAWLQRIERASPAKASRTD